MKKLMILGAGEAQLQIVHEALKEGYDTIVCDMRPDMEASKLANRYYQVDYTDRNAIYEIALSEHIDGIISNSEAAMVNVAWISEKLNLPGNPELSVKTLLSKTEFRNLQEKIGIFCPKHVVVNSVEEAVDAVAEIGLPVVVKPVLSSGSRGTAIINSLDGNELEEAYDSCVRYSRNGKVAVEQYIDMSSLVAYDAEIFVCNGHIFWDGLYASIRSEDAPMLPIMESLPLIASQEQITKIKSSVEKLIFESGIKLGEYNAETYFTKDGECFVIEINPRQAGNHIPDLVYEHSGVNFTKLLCTTAVGDNEYFNSLIDSERMNRPVTMYVVYSESEGYYEGLQIDKNIEKHITWTENLIDIGNMVSKKNNAGDSIAFVRMQFDTLEQQDEITSHISDYIKPIVKADSSASMKGMQ